MTSFSASYTVNVFPRASSTPTVVPNEAAPAGCTLSVKTCSALPSRSALSVPPCVQNADGGSEGGDAGGLHAVGEALHGLAAAQCAHGAAVFVSDEDGAVGRRRGVVGEGAGGDRRRRGGAR